MSSQTWEVEVSSTVWKSLTQSQAMELARKLIDLAPIGVVFRKRAVVR